MNPAAARAVRALTFAAQDDERAVVDYVHAQRLHQQYPDQASAAVRCEAAALLREVRGVQVQVAEDRLLDLLAGAR